MNFKIKPWKHQLEAIGRALHLHFFALFFEVGAGKTATAINILRGKYNKHKKILPTLILGPPIVIENWKREILMHSNIKESQILCLTGTGKERLEKLQNSDAQIVITNYETLLMKPVFEFLFNWFKNSFDPVCLVLDESHKVKSMTSKRTKLCIQLSDLCTYKFLLSGTPILNSLMDIFSQFRILDGGESFGTNYFAFRAKYFADRNSGMSRDKYFPDWKPRRGATADIKERIDSVSMHITKEECLDLPPLVKKTVPVEMSKKQAKLYNEMKNDFISFVENEDGSHSVSKAELAITKALRLQQIVSGYLPVEDREGNKQNRKIKDNPRAAALKELLEEITPSHKVIVWAVFKENYEVIREVCKSLKLEFVEITGDVGAKQKAQNVDTFNDVESCRVLLGHPGSGGVGINLVSASYSIFYSRNFSLEYEIQAEARNYRGGSEIHDKVTRLDLMTPDTIDELVMKALASKQDLGYQVLKKNLEQL